MSQHSIQMPERVEGSNDSPETGQFVIQPLERGYGVTIGNALRRVLLSSLEGIAITALRIDGVQHEFSSIEGVTEDVSDIILNLKQLRFKSEEYQEGYISFSLEGGADGWTGHDIQKATNDFTVLNPDLHLATVAEGVTLDIELRLGKGRGYVPSEDNKRPEDPIGVIPIDSIFTPIVSVKYEVTPTRVGQRVDYEKLTLDVVTDGSVDPEEALARAAQILRDHISLFIQMDAEPQSTVEPKEVDVEVQRIRELLSQSVDELDLSVRAHNCLKAANIKTIGDLVRREESEMLKFRNFGRKSLQELAHVLVDRGLNFGMDVASYLDEPAA